MEIVCRGHSRPFIEIQGPGSGLDKLGFLVLPPGSSPGVLALVLGSVGWAPVVSPFLPNIGPFLKD